ncbi:histidine kinase [Fibrisoma limi BUZ 3]|uniref:Histidine kinase n=1 Tax=Fibrisoma limi BUZ 3 TaxID=1185876 RepID=I2GL65_9BACT|nr:sensor histidine kinase [Fibrisoma limi]CCH54641.1 histidine kinase [Fibrisoma limi BUZ 3]
MRWLLFVLACLFRLVHAQHPFPVRHLTTADGLSQGTCYHILKDSRGFIWVGSQDGLNRFDGTRFTRYQFDELDSTTIGKGEIQGLVEAPSGDLWAGTEDCLSQYVRRTNSFRRYYVTNNRGQKRFSLHTPFYADDSTVWYCNAIEGVVKLNFRTQHKTFINQQIRPKSTITTEWINYRPADQSLVFLLPVGFARYHWPTRRLTTYYSGQPTDVIPGRQLFQSLYRARNGHYCLGSSAGIYEFDSTLTSLRHQHTLRPGIGLYRFQSMMEDQQGRWWLAVEGAGAWLYDPLRMQIVREVAPGLNRARSLLTNQISELYVDDLGLVWVNSDPFGIDIIYPDNYRIETFSDNPADVNDLNSHAIRGLCEDRRHQIWIGTVDGGIRRLDPASGTMRAYTVEMGVTTKGNIRHIVETRNGRLLIANQRGIQQYDPVGDRFVVIPNPLCRDDQDCQYIRGIKELPDGNFIVATYAGLFIHDPQLRPLGQVDAGSNYYGTLYFDAVTQLLYAGRRDQDLMVYQYKNGKLTWVYNTLPGFNILDIYPDPARRCLWICTDRGLVRFDPATRRTLRIYTTRQGLPNNVVYALLPDQKGRFWLSTNNGLAKFFPAQEMITPVSMTRGREYNSFAALASSDGTFYFGGVHGLDHFVPNQLDYNVVVPVRIADFQVNDKPYRATGFIGETGQVTLTSQQRTFSISFAALDYFSDGNNPFFYRLKGVDNNWVTLTKTNTVRYADVSPGAYTFQVRALDARGQLTPITQVQIRIQPPFWQTWWFILLSLAALVGLVVWGVSTFDKQRFARQQRLTQNTLAAQESERRRIAQDLHDDVGNTLATIKGMLERAREQEPVQSMHPEVHKAYDLIDKASNDLRGITHDLMPVEFEKYALPDVIQQLVDRVNRSSRMQFEFILFGTVRRLEPARELVTYRIITELIQNGLKHGGQGLAIVQLGYHLRHLSILVETPLAQTSTDQPFPTKLSPGIGQNNISYRAEYLHASLEIDRNEQSYIVMLDVPYDATGNHTRHQHTHH